MIRILVVEDDDKLNHIVCATLGQHGYEVIGCLGAIQAFDAMPTQMVDMIISDIMMPKMDGFEFATMVRELGQWDTMLHMTSGMLFSLTGYLLFVSLNRDPEVRRQLHPASVMLSRSDLPWPAARSGKFTNLPQTA